MSSYDKVKTYQINGREFFAQSKAELKRIDSALSHPTYLKYFPWDEEDYYRTPTTEEDDIELTKARNLEYTFHYYKIDLETWEIAKDLPPLDRAEKLYALFFNKFHYVVGHYFRHGYHILLLLEQTETEKKDSVTPPEEKQKIEAEFKRYAEFVFELYGMK